MYEQLTRLHYRKLGIVRKGVGLTFLGETRDDTHWILGLVELQGLGAEVGRKVLVCPLVVI